MTLEFNGIPGDFSPKNKEEEFKLISFAEFNGIPWEGQNIECVYMRVMNFLGGNYHLVKEAYEMSMDQISFEDFNFIKGERWEYVLFLNIIPKISNWKFNFKFKGNLNVNPYELNLRIRDNIYLNGRNPNDFFRNLIYIEFFNRRTDLNERVRVFEFFKSELKSAKTNFEKIRIISEKYDKDLKVMNFVLSKIEPWGYSVKTFDELINFYILIHNYELKINNFFKKYKTKISNERRKGDDREQVTLWLKKTTKLKLQKIASDRNISSSNLIEILINEKHY